ncbi:hypothetical protein INS49_004946 [Diaporthe citri]|uniref:uncharacterized protein n=1 Tax=Diaporthe citri TaxID=83186 RepID=UPI001C823E33|nr:uncharacterized protein INS49_004946 [Diaporthe citri]KAG6353975.1 hypothetical protein INS49_004946 [Diaporthe citri]
MPPRQVKPDPEVEGQGSPDLSAIQPVSGNTASPGNDTASGLRLPNLSPTHPLPVIHEAGESYFSSQFPSLQGTSPGFSHGDFLYPDMSGIGNIPSDPQDPFAFEQLYSPGENSMNNMPRNNLPSSGNARSQVGTGTGAGIIKRQSRPTRQGASAMNQAGSRAALGAAPNPGQASNQLQHIDVDLTGMDYPTGSPSAMGLYGSTLDSGMGPSSFASGIYNPRSGIGGGIQQNPQPQGYRNMSPVPKFENPELPHTPEFISPSQYESFAEEEQETKPDPRRLLNEGTPTPAHRRRSSLAQTDTSPATANTTSSPANNSFESPGQGGGGSSSGRQTAQNTPSHPAHVPPNRIQEAGPVTHPDPEWRPYGVNHWHVFLTEPTTLKYLSSTEIKDIRDHCYGLAQAAAVGAAVDEEDDGQPVPIAAGSRYTTADAQAVWRHCDAYVRRRSQVRNNQAARRSRQRKDAETRYWKAKALEYGAPDHEFNWDLVEEEPAGGQGGSSSAAAEGAGQAARARTRAQQGQAQAQAQQQQGQGQAGRSSGRQGQAAARRASAPSAPKPEFDFNQPFDYDEDDKSHGGGFDAFTGGF